MPGLLLSSSSPATSSVAAGPAPTDQQQDCHVAILKRLAQLEESLATPPSPGIEMILRAESDTRDLQTAAEPHLLSIPSPLHPKSNQSINTILVETLTYRDFASLSPTRNMADQLVEANHFTASHGDVDMENQTPEHSLGSHDNATPLPNVYPPLVSRCIIVFSLMLATFLSIIGTAIPMITTEFNSMADAGWYGSAFFLTMATFMSAWGKGYKYFSMKLAYILAVVIFEVGRLVCALAPNSIALICGRAIQGIGAAGTMTGGYTITAFVTPPHTQPIIIGLIGSVFTIASIAGPLLGGAFTSEVTWRWCFYINLPTGGLALLCMLFFFRTPPQAKANYNTPIREVLMNFDPVGSVLVFSGVLCFFMPVQWGGVVKPWSSSVVIGLLVGCVVIFGLFFANEHYQGDRALIVYRILGLRSIAASCGFAFFMNAANIALQYNLPIYFQAIQGRTPVDSGIRMIPSILGTALTTLVGSGVMGKLQMFQPFLLASGVLSVIGCGLIYSFQPDAGLGPIIGYQILYGVGAGLGVQTLNLVATITSTHHDVSIAVATVSFFLLLAGGWGVAVTDAILNNLILERTPRYAANVDPHAVLLVGAAGIHKAYSGEELRGVQMAYLDGLHGGWALGTAAFGVAVFWALVPEWPGKLAPPASDDDSSQTEEEKEAVKRGQADTAIATV
ncbi:uncharacterized protein JN550_002661 [Neoarthrinium moseri]|uniref:uncharacterized protein n=1 Tax=Neoarthrinium moseri TaxID=1658444 RepID=UPI001FDD4F6E|nr:uncharacterized protein JN550_002661 [Neoarthrinium moseri]KAI1874082.1 hypothetical protein JN550_002661 [Neoarthrinium moseri]